MTTEMLAATRANGWAVTTCQNGCCLVIVFEMPNGEHVAAQFDRQELVQFSADLRDTVNKIRLSLSECAGSA
jgi:hypothetical protein